MSGFGPELSWVAELATRMTRCRHAATAVPRQAHPEICSPSELLGEVVGLADQRRVFGSSSV